MPGRQAQRQQDPYHRIRSWDDGYEYVRDIPPTPPDRGNTTPFYSPPLGANRSYYEPEPPRRSKPSRDDTRRAYPSPPSDTSSVSDRDRDRRRRPERRGRSPPPYRPSRSPSPPPRRPPRDRNHYPPQSTAHRPRRPSLDSYPTAPLPRHQSTRHPNNRSPSPSYNRSNPNSQSTRPPLQRSKSTTASATAFAKERFANLSPQWKAAALAAFQAGSMAALKAKNQPGGWNGEKGAKIATAALGAAAMGALKGDGKKEDGKGRDRGGRSSGGGGKRGGAGGRRNSGVEAIGGALGGWVAEQMAKREGKRR